MRVGHNVDGEGKRNGRRRRGWQGWRCGKVGREIVATEGTPALLECEEAFEAQAVATGSGGANA